MKKFILSFFSFAILVCATPTMAQNVKCLPDKIYKDSAVGVYPRPYDAVLNPKGGITKSACINKPYEYVLTANVPDTFSFSNQKLKLYRIRMDTTGSVTGLPTGIKYACNPPNCVFEAKAQGCISLYGKAATSNTAKIYPLKITFTVSTDLGDVKAEFPGALAPGEYNFKLEPENSATCFVASANDFFASKVAISNSPNPFSDITNIEIISAIGTHATLKIYNITGQLIDSQYITIYEGENKVRYDAKHLHNGLYIYTIGNDEGLVTSKFVIGD